MAKNLFNAAGYGNLKEIKRFLKKGVPIDTPFHTGLTALSNAAFAGQLEAVQFLVSEGANLELANEFGVTPLTAATRNSYVNVISFLIHAGANIHHHDSSGETSVMIAANWSTIETLQTLVDAGANVLDQSPRGHTTLMLAVLNNDINLQRLEYLINLGVEINARTNDGASAYSYAHEMGRMETLDFLISHGAEQNDYITPWRRKNNKDQT